jgi:hypothetical protein
MRELTEHQKTLIRPRVKAYMLAQGAIHEAIIFITGEDGWTLNFETLTLTKPEEEADANIQRAMEEIERARREAIPETGEGHSEDGRGGLEESDADG